MNIPMPTAPVGGITRIVDAQDLDVNTYYELEDMAKKEGEIFLLVNDLSYKKDLSFKMVPFKSLLNKYVDNISCGNISLKENKNGLEKNTDLDKIIDTINHKINGVKGGITKKINSMRARIDYLESAIEKLLKEKE